MALPDFLVVGVPKAGTTALHAALARHPGLYLSAVKEPKFFLTDGPPPARGGPGDAQTYREHIWRRAAHAALSRALRSVEAAGRHLPGTAGAAVATGLERFLQRDSRPRQPLTWDERQAVLPRLADDIRLLEKIIGGDFGDWLQPRERSGGQVGARPTGQYQARNGRLPRG